MFQSKNKTNIKSGNLFFSHWCFFYVNLVKLHNKQIPVLFLSLLGELMQ